jgi:hypothetical protein
MIFRLEVIQFFDRKLSGPSLETLKKELSKQLME